MSTANCDRTPIATRKEAKTVLDHRMHQYEIAAACSGLRSLIVTLAFFTIYAFVGFQKSVKRGVMILSAFPFAVAGNVFRLAIIILSAEVIEAIESGSGQGAGEFVHNNSVLSLLPYVPAFAGMLILGRLLKEDRQLVANHPHDGTGEPSSRTAPVS